MHIYNIYYIGYIRNATDLPQKLSHIKGIPEMVEKQHYWAPKSVNRCHYYWTFLKLLKFYSAQTYIS